MTAGPLSFMSPLLSKDGKQIFAIGESDRAEVIRYDSRSSQFVPYFSGISAEGLGILKRRSMGYVHFLPRWHAMAEQSRMEVSGFS